MPTALLCTQTELEAELGHTLLWRGNVDRHVAHRLEEARMMAVAARPDLIVVDRDFPRAEKLVAQLREDPTTRGLSVVIIARGDFDPGEVDLLEAGANAILRIPPGADWDDRLRKLFAVPARRDVRFPVQFAVSAVAGGHPLAAQALNLSSRGMLLETSETLTVGDELRLSFRLPESPGPVTGWASVVRLAAPSQFGVEFRKIDDKGGEHIGAFVASLSAA